MGDEYGEGSFNEGQTKFDTGLSQVYRIDGELKRINYFRRVNMLDDWHKCLMTLYAEGYPMFKKKDNDKDDSKDEKKDGKEVKKRFTPLKDHKEFQTSYSEIFKTKTMVNVLNEKDLLGKCWKTLYDYELKLRANLDFVGLGHSEKEQDIY